MKLAMHSNLKPAGVPICCRPPECYRLDLVKCLSGPFVRGKFREPGARSIGDDDGAHFVADLDDFQQVAALV